MRIAVLRPEPGNAATAAQIEALGHEAIRLPLFEVVPLDWTLADPADHDALILTSANTLRHGGARLARYKALPVHAVGAATAAAARAAGFEVVATGEHGVEALLTEARVAGVERALHLGGHERNEGGAPITRAVAVYASDPVIIGGIDLRGATALLHSRRAALRLAELVVGERSETALVAISDAVAEAAGKGWRSVNVADRPADATMIALALAD